MFSGRVQVKGTQ